MNQITKGPNPTPQFGYDFDYAVWTPGTRIDLVNVPFNNDYRDVVAPDFDMSKYIDNLTPSGITISDMTYVRQNHPIRVNIPFSRANRYNYLRATNPAQPIDGDIPTTFYYFILEVRYIAGNTTELVLQIDVWNTYINHVNFGNCYVEQGHIAIANTNAMDHYGRDYLTIPDGLDIGSAYRTISQHAIDVAGYTPMEIFSQNLTNVMVISTTDLMQNPYDSTGKPKLDTAPGSSIQSLASGASIYLFESIGSFTNFMYNMKEYSWITQGIVSVTMVPTIKRYLPDFEFQPNGVPSSFPQYSFAPIKHIFNNNWRQKIVDALPERYKHLARFLTSPYCLIEMTTWSGTPLQLKPELWNRDDMFVVERATYLPPSQRIQFYPRGYNTYATEYLSIFGLSRQEMYDKWVTPGLMDEPTFAAIWDMLGDVGDDYGDYLDLVTQITSFPSVPIVNNMAVSYLASNYNSLAYQRQSADWSQQRAMGSAQAQYDISTGAIATGQVLTAVGVAADTSQVAITNNAQMQQAAVSLISSPAVGAAGGAFAGGRGAAVGAITGAIGGIANTINTGIQMTANSEANNVRNNAAWQRNRAETQQARLSRDTNVDLARWAARGDYSNTISGINAKIQDAQLLQPSVNGQFGGDASNMIHGTMELNVRIKMIDLQAIRTVGEYWLRYGYPVRTFMVPPKSLMTMEKFTYWKMSETYISSATVPEGFKQPIRGILEKGVTVWGNPDYIGKIDMADNAPLGGISY